MTDEYQQRLLEAVADELFADVDGFVKYWPKQGGFLDAHHLRVIADELDKRNAQWAAEVEAYFDTP